MTLALLKYQRDHHDRLLEEKKKLVETIERSSDTQEVPIEKKGSLSDKIKLLNEDQRSIQELVDSHTKLAVEKEERAERLTTELGSHEGAARDHEVCPHL